MQFIFLHLEMVYDFHHGCEVTQPLKRSWIDIYDFEQFLGIDKVEVACQCEVAGGYCVAFDEGVAIFHVIFTLCAITEVA